MYKDHITLEDYEIHDGMGLELVRVRKSHAGISYHICNVHHKHGHKMPSWQISHDLKSYELSEDDKSAMNRCLTVLW